MRVLPDKTYSYRNAFGLSPDERCDFCCGTFWQRPLVRYGEPDEKQLLRSTERHLFCSLECSMKFWKNPRNSAYMKFRAARISRTEQPFLTKYESDALTMIREYCHGSTDLWFKPGDALVFWVRRRDYLCHRLWQKGYLDVRYRPDFIEYSLENKDT